MIQLRYKVVVVLLMLGSALGLVRYCGRPHAAPGTLAPGEKEHITVKGHTLTITDKKGTTKQYIPDRVDISVTDLGTVKVKAKEFGFGLEPGAGILYAGNTFKPFGDTRLFFYYQASLHAGLDFDLNRSTGDKSFLRNFVRPILFVNYSLPILDGQIGAFVGYELAPNTPMGGLRWRF